MCNHWIARATNPFAQWTANLGNPTDAAALERALELARQILAAGERYSVYRIQEAVQVSNGIDFQMTPNYTYADYLERTLAETGRLPLFDFSAGVAQTADGRILTPGRMCYYDAECCKVESEVYDVGVLLRGLRPGRDWGQRFMKSVAPVTILSRTVNLSAPGRPIRVTINLFTDVWFPRVMGFLEDAFANDMYDNRELFNCHTPRLNRFLLSVREAVGALGGEWRLSEPEDPTDTYTSMVTDHGIILGP